MFQPKRIHQFDPVTESELLNNTPVAEIEVETAPGVWKNRRVRIAPVFGGGGGQVINCGGRLTGVGEVINCGSRF